MTFKLKPDPPEPDKPKPTLPNRPAPGSPSAQKKSEVTDIPKPSPKKKLYWYRDRLTSLDAFRGFIMLMLAASGFGIAALARKEADQPVWNLINYETWQSVAFQFSHPEWISSFAPGETSAQAGSPWQHFFVSFWDLIQPSFMFMVGVAMPFSYARREKTGQSGIARGFHALLRAAILVLLGVFLQTGSKPATDWQFPNVLAQIGLGYFFAYLLLGQKAWIQWSALVVILAGTWAAFFFTPLPNNYAPAAVNASAEKGEVLAEPFQNWSKNGNVFHQFDVWFLNQFPRPEDKPFEFNYGGYATLNFVPSIGTMLLGILCGQLLVAPNGKWKKLGILLLAAGVCWGLGLATGATVCPIIKRIWTPSWVLFSGGYVIALLALFYFLFDILPFHKVAYPLVVIGMNSITAYMMGQLLRPWIINRVIQPHFGWLIEWGLGTLAVQMNWHESLGVSAEQAGPAMYEAFQPIVDTTTAFLVMWLILYWMYKNRFFVKI